MEVLIIDLHDVQQRLNALAEAHRVVVLADETTVDVCYPRVGNEHTEVVVVPKGESAKTLEVAQFVWQSLYAMGYTRNDYLVTVGGGAITDLGGFVASTFMRGMNLIHIPTTLLAMVDASIGGKTGIDFGGLKNSVGTFYSPKEVWVSLAFLETLDRNDLLSGYGEILKYGLLIGKDYLCSINTDEEITPFMLQTAIQYKIDVVTSDFEDKGERMHLNLGHTSAHALEALYISRGEFLPHGVAVSAGLVVALYLSYRRYGLEQEVLTSFVRQVQSIMPVVYFTCDDYDDLWQLALKDKKRLSSKELTMVLLHDIGQPFTHNVSRHDFFEALDFYRDFMGF